jgi:hypothetical protein
MPYRSAKSTLLAVILIASTWVGLANDPSYHDEITAITKRYRTLANRKALGGILSPAEEKERQCLLGQLIDQDPVSELTREVTADFLTLQQASGKAEERATAEKLLQLVQITTAFEGRAESLPEARSFANVLRKFVVRRDVEGARAWAKAQTLPP